MILLTINFYDKYYAFNQSKKFKALEKNILVQYFVGTQHKDWTQKSIENMTKIQWKI